MRSTPTTLHFATILYTVTVYYCVGNCISTPSTVLLELSGRCGRCHVDPLLVGGDRGQRERGKGVGSDEEEAKEGVGEGVQELEWKGRSEG